MGFENLKRIDISDLDKLIKFKQAQISPHSNGTDLPSFVQEWSSSSKEEALEHYLNLGWSMAYFEKQEVKGYVLVQPLLFFQSHPQSLWVEDIQCENPQVGQTLLEAILKISKEKHLQQVLFTKDLVTKFKGFKMNSVQDMQVSYIKTTKWSEL